MKGKSRTTLDAIRRRLTGFSIPVFGVSWNPPEPRRDAARRLITFLEDRRVLYAPEEMEVPSHCVSSVLDIRRYLTEELQRGSDDDDLTKSVRAMRAACRKFLDVARNDVVRFGGRPGHWASWRFNGALGELRGVFGVHLARIAVQYGVDVDDDLAAILPGEDEAD
ncbi:MAG TPA: DUF6650 family protein [Candidatus Binatia bacterium]|nr:DUF6650 family protein [Candidatus Binatia bacterium]